MFRFLRQKVHNLISDEKFSEILTGSAWALGARVIATVFGMITSIIIARWYGAEVLGIVALLNSFLMLVTIFTLLGTNTSILRLIPEHISKHSPTSAFKVYRKTQYCVAAVSVFTGTILFLASGFIADTVFSKPHLRFYLALASAFVIFKSLMQLNTQAIRGLRLIRVFALMQLLPHLSMLVILALITVFFYHLDNPIYAMFASITISALVGVLIMERAFQQKKTPNDTLNLMPMREILSISIPMLMTATMTFVIGQTGVIILGIFRPQTEVGYYAAAVKLATLTAFVLTAVNSMAAPKFSELFHSGQLDRLFPLAQKISKLVFWTTMPLLILLVLLGRSLLCFLYGVDFEVAYFAMVFLLLGQFINSISGSTAMFMNMTGQHQIFRNIILGTALLNIILSLLLIPNIGINGAALAGASSLAFWNMVTLYYIKITFGKTISYICF